MTCQFGPFLLNSESRLLLRDGKPLPLTAKVMETLIVLVQNRGRVIDKDELIAALWPDTVVEEANLTQNISTLRKALGDNPKDRLYIATIAGRGYQFVAPVTESRTSTQRTHHKQSFLRPWVAIAVVSPIVLTVLAGVLWRYPSWHSDVIERKLTGNSLENSIRNMAISPDGRHLAYADNTGIFLKLIRTGETHPVPLPPDFAAGVDDWFPDGSHLLVSRAERPGKVGLWTISVFGGPPHHLADDASGGAVSPDGGYIAFRRNELTYDGLWGREEWVMRSDGTDQVKVAPSTSDGFQLGAPTWSPDGKRIAYIRSIWAYNARTSSVEVNEWRKGNTETLFSDSRLSPALHWLPDGRLIYAFGSAQHQQDSSLWVVSLQTSRKVSSHPKHLIGGHGWISQVTGSADGKVVVFLRGNWLPSAYIATMAADGTHLLANSRLTLDENENIPTAWTPDGGAVLFSSDRNGTREIFKQAIDRPSAESVVSSPDHLSQPILTPDGSEILYISIPKSHAPETLSSIFAIPMGGGTPRLILKDVGIYQVECATWPSTICLYSIAKGSIWETFRFDVRTGKSTDPPQIDPACNWSLSPDGSQRAIIVFRPNTGTIQLRSTATGKSRDLIVKGWSGLMGINWSSDGLSLLVSWHPHEWDSALLKVTLDGKASVLLRSSNPEIWNAIPSPDGRLLAIAEASGPKNVWQIENF